MKLIWSALDRTFGSGGIVAYHGVGSRPFTPVMHVSPERLRVQLEFLCDHYTIVPLRELLERLQARQPTNTLVAITFDDAYAGVALHALPILEVLGLPATVFVASDHATVGGTFWWDSAEQERVAAQGGRWAGHPQVVGLTPLDGDDARSMDVLRTRVLAQFAGRWPAQLRASDDPEWRSLRFGELEELARSELIDFGVHTRSHPSLPALPFDEQVTEIRGNFAILRARLPRVLPVVAYPYGLYDRGTLRAASAAGMIAGVTMEGRATGMRPDLFTLPRVGIGEIHGTSSISRRLMRAMRMVLVLRNRGAHPRIPERRS